MLPRRVSSGTPRRGGINEGRVGRVRWMTGETEPQTRRLVTWKGHNDAEAALMWLESDWMILEIQSGRGWKGAAVWIKQRFKLVKSITTVTECMRLDCRLVPVKATLRMSYMLTRSKGSTVSKYKWVLFLFHRLSTEKTESKSALLKAEQTDE